LGVYRGGGGQCPDPFVQGGDVDCNQLPAAYKPADVLDPSDLFGLGADDDGIGCDQRLGSAALYP
jgi:hypothetical protein